MIKKWLLLNSILIYKNRHPIYDQDGGKMAKIDTLFMTKRLKNPTLSGRTYLYSPYKGVPPGCFYEFNSSMNSIFRKIILISINSSKYSMNLDLWRIQIFVNSHVWILNPTSAIWTSVQLTILGTLRNRTAGGIRTTEWRKNVARARECTVSRDIFSSFCRPEFSSRPFV